MSKTKRLTQVRAGRMVRAVLYTQATVRDEPKARQAKSKISSAARMKLNHRASWQKLEELMAENFDGSDLWITFSYRDADLPPTREAAVRCFNRFLSMLRQQRRARGEDVLYLKNVEHMTEQGEEGRWHHHLVLNATGSDYEEIRALWSKWGDNVDFEPLLDGDHDYAARAQYLCKERQPLGKQTWTPSRNLRRPQRDSRMVDEAEELTPPPEAVILEREVLENAWGSFTYVKYILPRRPLPPPRLSRARASFF